MYRKTFAGCLRHLGFYEAHLMDLNVVFDVPARIVEGLANGSLERVGGVIRDSSNKQVVTWLQEGGSELSRNVVKPPVGGLGDALSAANPILGAVNVGVSVAGFTMVLQELNRVSEQIRVIEAKVDRVSDKLDDQVVAKLKAGVYACQNAVELQEPALRTQMAGYALTTLHEARQFFIQQVVRSAARAEAASADYVGLAFVALLAEAQTYLQLDEGAKAARVLRQGLTELRPGLTQLMNAVLECSCHYLKPEFIGEVDLGVVLWLHNGYRRMQRTAGEPVEQVTASQLFDLLRLKMPRVFKSYEDWHGEIPQVVVDTRKVPDWYLGPVNQGTDKSKRYKLVKKELSKGLSKIAAIVEAHDRLTSQVLQLEQMEQLGLKPSELRSQLQLPEGQAAAVVLDARWIAEEVPT